MTRIALLGPANSIHLQRWAHALAGRGHAVCVLSQHACERALLPAAAELFMLPHRGAFGYFANAWRVRRVLARWRPEVLNAHYASGYGTTAALCGVRPLLLSVWGSDVHDFPYQSAFKGWLLRWNLRRATALASTSHAMARQVRRLTPERSEIAVTPFGVDLARFRPDASRRDRATLTIGIVKSLATKYGVDLLLRAFAGLVADADVQALPGGCRLVVVGDGPQRAELEALARSLGIAPRTEFAGAVAHGDVPAWLNRLDIYAAPSRLDSESFGVAVIEAGACALPVVVSDAGGLPEVVRDGETGLVVPRDDVPALQAALKRLVLDAGLRERLGRAARARAAGIRVEPLRRRDGAVPGARRARRSGAMKNRAQWRPTKFEMHRGRLRGSRDARELGVGSRLISDLVAAQYQARLPAHARGALLDLGCGKVPLYAAYAAHVDEVICVDWAPGEHIDQSCDLSQPLPFGDGRFDTIVLSDVLEHIPEPALLWREMTRVLAPGGKIVMNVPFYYSVHAHPHDYYRYTNFALERFVQLNALELVCLVPIGGIVEIMADLVAKALSKLPVAGPPLAMATQAVVGAFGRTRLGARVARVSSRHFPFGYFMIAQRPHAPPP